MDQLLHSEVSISMVHLITTSCAHLLIFVLMSCSLPSNFGEISLVNTVNSPERSAKNQKQYNQSQFDARIAKSQEGLEMLNPEQVISAQVLLVAATGRIVDGNTTITSQNIDDYRPSEATAQLVSQYFKKHGFEVSPLVGISFTISASARHFSEFFDTSLAEDAASGIQAVPDSITASSELPLAQLEKTIADSIVSVTFVPPPDFGPTNFSF